MTLALEVEPSAPLPPVPCGSPPLPFLLFFLLISNAGTLYHNAMEHYVTAYDQKGNSNTELSITSPNSSTYFLIISKHYSNNELFVKK